MSESGLFENVYSPDVLSCLANLSSDEMVTSPEVVSQFLDILPQNRYGRVMMRGAQRTVALFYALMSMPTSNWINRSCISRGIFHCFC